jgi:stress-induced morphogen
MITPDELQELIQLDMPDAQVVITDKTGMQDHYEVSIVSTAFAGLGLLDQRRRVYEILNPVLQTGRLHAVELKTQTPPSG